MLKQVYRINENGFLTEIYVKEFDENGNCIEELGKDIVTVDPPNGLYRAKWTGTEWVSTTTEEEYIATLPKEPEREPTETEKLQEELVATNAMLLEFMEIILA